MKPLSLETQPKLQLCYLFEIFLEMKAPLLMLHPHLDVMIDDDNHFWVRHKTTCLIIRTVSLLSGLFFVCVSLHFPLLSTIFK